MQTTATWQPRTSTFDIHSPTTLSQKYWITNSAVHAQWCVVFAQTIIGSTNHGIHGFLVRCVFRVAAAKQHSRQQSWQRSSQRARQHPLRVHGMVANRCLCWGLMYACCAAANIATVISFCLEAAGYANLHACMHACMLLCCVLAPSCCVLGFYMLWTGMCGSAGYATLI
jgi:hypothetical protein